MILIAVQSRTVAMQVDRLCRADGMQTLLASKLNEARGLLAEHPVTALVADDWFPDGRGAELIQEIRQTDGMHLAIVSLAAASADGETQADATVAKAELTDKLMPVLRRLLKLHQPETTLGRVLVVDDSRTYREQLRASLEAAGYRVVLAETGEEGVRCAFEHRPDAMLVDSMLPGIDGAAVIRRIRSESVTRRTPCLLLTASEDAQQELEALEAGADTFVRKNEPIAVILARLAGVLRSASTPAASSMAALPQLPRRVALVGSSAVLERVGTVLLDEGCETFTLQREQATPERCAALEPDVLLLAVELDDATLQFCRNCKTLPGLRNSRLLVLDQRDGRNDAIAAIMAGADDYLPAASDPSIVLARTRSQLRRKRVEDENRGLREHMLRQELETEAQRALAQARSQHADEMRVAYGLAERKAHEAERARLELEQVTEGIPQIVWTSGADGRQAHFNGRWTDYTGLPRDQTSGYVWRRVIHREDLQRALRDWVKSVEGNLPYSSEYRLKSAAGEYRWFLVRAIPLAGEDGAIDRWFGTCTDVQEQRLAEEALRRTEKLAATGRLAASIAHEINNPLEAVTNLLYLIESNVRANEDTHGYVVTAQKELDRVAQISKKTLAFYRESTNAAPVDLCGLVHEVADIYSVRLQRKNLEMKMELECTRKPEGLAGELRQVISNLVTNAIDASPVGGVLRVRVRDARRWMDKDDGSEAEEGVRVSVADHGHGIPAALQGEIFKPFITTKGQKGTGLGLWLSHSILTRHGGTVQLKSAVGKGTCFSLFLPLRHQAPPVEGDSMGAMLKTIGGELLGQA